MKIKPLKLNATGALAAGAISLCNSYTLYAPVAVNSQSEPGLLCFIYKFACETLQYPQASLSPRPSETLLLP